MTSATDGLARRAGIAADTDRAAEVAAPDIRLEDYVDRIAQELHERVEHQRAVLRAALGARGAGAAARYCPLVDCARIEALRSAIRETVAVLEETRSAFKSKRLEVVRKRLIEILDRG